MTLEDFFTLTELEDGFTDPARVKELFAVIIQEDEDKVSVAKKVDVSIRQWSTIASAIIATGNKDCLDTFVQLDRLRFISKWLQEAQNFGTETGDALVEDLLRVLDKLQIDKNKLLSSGIWTTVENIVHNNNNSMVQERAKALVFNKWKQEVESDSDCAQDIKMATRVEDKGISPSNDGKNSAQHPGDEQKRVDFQTSGNSLDHAIMTDDAEQMRNISSTNEKLAVPLEQRDEPPPSATNVTNTSAECDSKEDIDAKDRDPCPSKNSEHNSSGVMEQANDGAENDSEILAGPQHSPDTRKGEEKRNIDGPHNETQTGPIVSTEASSMAKEPATEAKNLGVENGSCIQDFSSITETCQEQQHVSKVNGLCDFDLNQQVNYEDEQLDLVSKQRGEFVDFDLNVAEDSDDNIIIETLPPQKKKQIVTSSRCLLLDLNRVSDDGSADVIQSQSPSSTSSSLRNIDLNDQPYFQNNDEPVICIMGARVKVNSQNFVPQTLPLSQTNISIPGTPGVLGFGSGTSRYVGPVAFGASMIPYAASSSAPGMPYIMNMSGAASTGVAVDNNFDLNSGSTTMMMEEEVNICTTGGLFGEHFRGTKRKEADCQWDFFPANFKHSQPPRI